MAAILRRKAMASGPLGGSRNWTIVWAVIMGFRLLKRFTSGKPEVVYRERLEPGRTLVIRNGDRPVTVIGPGGVTVEK